MSIAKEIFYGNVGSHDCLRNNAEIRGKWGLVETLNSTLTSLLTKEQKVFYEQFKDALQDVTADETANVYEYGFNLGVAIGYESKKAMGVDENASDKDSDTKRNN